MSFIHNSIYSFFLAGLAFRHIYQSQAQQGLVPPSFLSFFLLNHSNQVQKVKAFLRNQLMVFMFYVVTPKTSRQGNISAFLEWMILRIEKRVTSSFVDRPLNIVSSFNAVQWLRLCTSTDGDPSSILGQWAKILHAVWSKINVILKIANK